MIYADHGYHPFGTEIEVPTSYTFGGMTEGPETIVRMVLKSWTHPLDADPGPALIELNLGTASERTNMCAEITPAGPWAVARALLDLADTAERDGPRAAAWLGSGLEDQAGCDIGVCDERDVGAVDRLDDRACALRHESLTVRRDRVVALGDQVPARQ